MALMVMATVMLAGTPVHAVQKDAPAPKHPKPLKMMVRPVSVKQGDPLMVRITGGEGMEEPTGKFLGMPLRFSPCGVGCYQAIAGVPQSTKSKSYRIVAASGPRRFDAMVRVTPGNYGTVALTLPPDKVKLNDEDEARADREEAKVLSIRREVSPTKWSGSFVEPIKSTVSTPYGVKRVINKGLKISFHKGIDLRGAMGDPVVASGSGMVALAEELFFGGNTIMLDHGDGIFTVYMHLSELKAKVGDAVAKGDVIGLVGSTGRSTGPHLHFSAVINTVSVSPLSFFKLPLGPWPAAAPSARKKTK